jgi:hypothetical protein
MPSKKLLKKCQFFDQHFEEDKADIIFKFLTKDICTKNEIIQKMRCDKPTKTIYDSILKNKAEGDDVKKVQTHTHTHTYTHTYIHTYIYLRLDAQEQGRGRRRQEGASSVCVSLSHV